MSQSVEVGSAVDGYNSFVIAEHSGNLLVEVVERIAMLGEDN